MGLILKDNFTKSADGEQPTPQSKRVIDPKNPIASLAQGPQQFTAIADTAHGNGDIKQTIADQMGQIAKAGIKKIILEYPPTAQTNDLLRRLNNSPPLVDDQEILRNSALFESIHDDGTGNTGTAHANLLIAAKNNGIKVYFSGDNRGSKEWDAYEKINQDQQTYLKKHPTLDKYTQKLSEDPEFLNKLNWPEKEKRALETRIATHLNTMQKFYDKKDDAYKAYDEARMGPDAEKTRADRFVTLAQGEKTMVIFGRDHFSKTNDLNEAIDRRLRQDAFKNGTSLNIPRTEVMEIWASKTQMENAHNTESQLSTAPPNDPSARYFMDTKEVEIPAGSSNRLTTTPEIARPSPTPREQLLTR